MSKDIHIGFVCQAGRLEAQSCLLAASVAARVGNHVRMTVTVAGSEDNAPDARTLAFLERLGANIRNIDNPLSASYPIGNKLACLEVIEDKASACLFMDSDMIVLDDFSTVFDSDFEFMAKPADAPTADLDAEGWQHLFTGHGVDFPRARYSTTHISSIGIPYFNAGFVALAPGIRLADRWIHHARKLARDRKKHDYHLDQISLSLAIYDRKLAVRPLSESINFPSHLRPVPDSGPPDVVHYHHPETVAGNVRVRNSIRHLLGRFPDLSLILKNEPEWHWASNLAPRSKIPRLFRHTPTAKTTDFVITGIPRSGTSLLSSEIEGRLGEAIVINEPAEIFTALERPGGHGLAVYYQKLRGRILAGLAVENKVDSDGRLVTDTLSSDVRKYIHYSRRQDDFPLGTKNTLAYLNRLEQIAACMPEAPILCCLRNPISTIASWTRSFDHLRVAKTGNARIGTSRDPNLSTIETRMLEEIESEENLEIRRALWWNYLSERILRNIDRLTLIRYESFTLDPTAYMVGFAASLGIAKRKVHGNKKRRNGLQIVDRSDEVSGFQREVILGICGSNAARLGYEL